MKRMSTELQTLILAYRVVFLDAEAAEFRNMYQLSEQERLMKLATYHSVRPVLYQALKKAGVDDSLTRSLQFFASQMAMRDKLYGKETVRLLKVLNEAGIAALPYKGYLFTEKLYSGQHFRESGDMDIVVRGKEQAVEALDLLCAGGYALQAPCSSREVVNEGPGREVSLTMESRAGLLYHLDFHWGVNEKYHLYSITPKAFFEGACPQPFAGEEVLIPEGKGLFKMLLNHHGGRACWLKLKEVFDFALFLKNTGAAEEEMERWASEITMDRVWDTGKQLRNLLEGREASQGRIQKQIVHFWESGESYDKSLWRKLRKMRLYFNLQNPDINRFYLLSRYALYHGTDTPLYEKYYRPFGGKSRALNFMVKMGTIFYRGMKGAYK